MSHGHEDHSSTLVSILGSQFMEAPVWNLPSKNEQTSATSSNEAHAQEDRM